MKAKTRIKKSNFYKDMTRKGLTYAGVHGKGIMYTLTGNEKIYMRFNKQRKSFFKITT